MHGVGYGLDESESFESQIAGFIDAVKSAEIPDQLERITFAERNSGRAERLKKILEEILPNGIMEFDTRWNIKNVSPIASENSVRLGMHLIQKSMFLLTCLFDLKWMIFTTMAYHLQLDQRDIFVKELICLHSGAM